MNETSYTVMHTRRPTRIARSQKTTTRIRRRKKEAVKGLLAKKRDLRVQ